MTLLLIEQHIQEMVTLTGLGSTTGDRRHPERPADAGDPQQMLPPALRPSLWTKRALLPLKGGGTGVMRKHPSSASSQVCDLWQVTNL